jgi:surface antigen
VKLKQKRTQKPIPNRARHLLPGLPAVVAVAGLMPAAMASAATVASAHGHGVPSRELCSGYAGCDARGFPSHGYGSHRGRSYWRMFAGNECTNYVAYVEHAVFHAPTPRYLLGNAGQWPRSAAAHGVLVNHTPSRGAVAVWDSGAAGVGPAGHVAVVERVGPRDRYILISQQHISGDADGYDWTRISAGFPARDWQEWPDQFIHFVRPVRTEGVGYYNRRTGQYRLRGALGSGRATIRFRLGGAGSLPLVGNWTGRGGVAPGSYNPRTGTFHLGIRLGSGQAFRFFRFGPSGMIPLVGNWTGRGHRDGIGYYDARTGTFHLRNKPSAGRPDHVFRFGPAGMIPLVGNWTGRRDGIGYYDPRTGWFHLRDWLSDGQASASFRVGPPGMIPLVGNWTGTSRDSIGYYNPHTGWFHLRRTLAGRPDVRSFRFGPAGMTPLLGDWARR